MSGSSDPVQECSVRSEARSPVCSVLAPSSDALVSNSFLLLLVRHLLLEAMHLFLVAS